ncbi:hypothetical protein [Pendulispora albinea]|uniref:Uncharacterized protein n=1 Tax=Pendulispora albinea TaxID=2741071 RepID=A0ABZ2MAR2_9BACT
MNPLPGSPRLLKGAIVGLDPFNPVASIIPFQYNPENLDRTVAATAVSAQRNQDEVLRIGGPPRETIGAEVEFSAIDDLDKGGAVASALGLHPVLASLEMLLYPKSALMIANEVLAQIGIIEIIPPSAPLTFFIWGLKRVVPIRLTQIQIHERAFDSNLNPIRATVNLTMEVLTYRDLGLASVGGAAFLAHQVLKEAMATIHGVGAVTGAGSVSVGASFG